MLVEPSASDEDAVISAEAPFATFSASVFASLSESVGVEASNSSWSVIEIVIEDESVSEPSALSALITMAQDVAVS